MKPFSLLVRSRSVLISIIVFYTLFVALLISFSSQFVSDVSINGSISNIGLLVLVSVFPLALIIIVIVYIIRLARDRIVGKPGIGFRLRLLFFFFIAVLIASVPQAALSVTFMRAALNSWFGAETGLALSGGVKIALSYYDERLRRIEQAASGELLQELTELASNDPDRVWHTVRRFHPDIDAIQIVDSQSDTLYFAGLDSAMLSATQVQLIQGGVPVRDSTAQISALRFKRSYSTPDGERAIILSLVLPQNFDVSARRLTDATVLFSRLERFRSLLLIGIVLFFGYFSLPLFLLAIVASIFLGEDLSRPIGRLEEATQRITTGDYSYRIISRSNDILGHLSESFNRMTLELERSQMQMLQTEKLTTWQEIAQQLAHEIKNPLTPIKLATARALNKFREKDADFGKIFESAAATILREVDAITKLLNQFRDFSRPPVLHLETVSLHLLIEEVGLSFSSEPEVTINYDGVDEGTMVKIDPTQMKRVFSNLFRNAIEATKGQGEIVVLSDHIQRGDGSYCRIRVRDAGSGIAPEDHDKVFNPYYTTKSHGAGLGLPIIERIIFDHGGRLWFESEPGHGATFYIDLPLGAEE